MRFSVTILVVLILATIFRSESFVHTARVDGVPRIVDSEGNRLYIRGVQLEGWLQMTANFWADYGLVGETHVYEGIRDVIGDTLFEEFRESVHETFITRADIARIKQLGFNLVRVPVNHQQWDSVPHARHTIDSLVRWCSDIGVYVMIDLHSTPCPQNLFPMSDYVPFEKTLWEEWPSCMGRVCDIWRDIAKRYQEERAIYGYDLINEPSTPADEEWKLQEAYREIIAAIREIDTNHLILLEADKMSKDFSSFTPPEDTNIAYQFHTYDWFGEVTRDTVSKYAAIAREHGVPLINGEFGANRNSWVESAVSVFEDQNSGVDGWVFWNWKSDYHPTGDFLGMPQGEVRYIQEATISSENTPNWDILMHYASDWFRTAPKPAKSEALKGIDEFLGAIVLDKCSENHELIRILFQRANDIQIQYRVTSRPAPFQTSPTTSRFFTLTGRRYLESAGKTNNITSARQVLIHAGDGEQGQRVIRTISW